MANQLFNVLGSIVLLAMVSVALKSRYTSGIVSSFFGGFSNSVRAASQG